MLITALAYFAGVAVAAPPSGPLTMLFYRHAMLREFQAAGAVAAVIAIADGFYAAISTYGHVLLLAAPTALVLGLRLAGVVLLTGLGLRYLLFPPRFEVLEEDRVERVGPAAAEGMGIAFLNPSALLSWIVVVDVMRTTFGFGADLTLAEKVLLPVAVSAGVASWFGLVLFAWRTFVKPPSPNVARAVVRVVGAVLLATAAVYGWQATHPEIDPLPAELPGQ